MANAISKFNFGRDEHGVIFKKSTGKPLKRVKIYFNNYNTTTLITKVFASCPENLGRFYPYLPRFAPTKIQIFTSIFVKNVN